MPYRFGEFSVDPLTRVLTRGGVALAVEPKVFDMIVLLMEQRHRVVTKRELLDAVWGRRVVVTEGVIARTVMKARRLLGDDAAQPEIIKTVQRVGYRFAGVVESGPKLATARPAPAVAHPVQHQGHHQGHHPGAVQSLPAALAEDAPTCIALLPFRDLTGRSEYAWIDLGLMTVTIDALLQADPPGRVLPAVDVLSTVGADSGALSLEQAARRLAGAGVTDVLRASIERPREGGFVLSCEAWGPLLADWQWREQAAEPTALARQFADAVASRVRAAQQPPEPTPPRVAHAGVSDGDLRFARQAHARAHHAMASQRWAAARKLLRVALDVVPHDPDLRLDYAECLFWRRDPEAGPLLDAAVREAQTSGDPGREIRALHLLALSQYAADHLPSAEDRLSAALAVARRLGDTASECELLLSMADLLMREDRPPLASWALESAGRLVTADVPAASRARWLDLRGRVERAQGRQAEARAAFTEAAEVAERAGLHASAAFSLLHAGECQLLDGQVRLAADGFERGLGHAVASGQPAAIGISAALCLRYGSPHRSPEQRLQLLESRLDEAGGGFRDLARGFGRSARGDFAGSLAHLDAAESRLGTSASLRFLIGRRRVRVLLALGRLDEAADHCDELKRCAGGPLKRPVTGTVMHMQAQIARAHGVDAVALRALNSSIEMLRPSIDRIEAQLDAAWMHLEAGETGAAQSLLAQLEPFLSHAVADGYGPAMLVQAFRLHLQGEGDAAVALQERYGEVHAAPAGSAAARWLTHYRSGTRPGSGRGPALRVLPSLCDLLPDLGPVKGEKLDARR